MAFNKLDNGHQNVAPLLGKARSRAWGGPA